MGKPSYFKPHPGVHGESEGREEKPRCRECGWPDIERNLPSCWREHAELGCRRDGTSIAETRRAEGNGKPFSTTLEHAAMLNERRKVRPR